MTVDRRSNEISSASIDPNTNATGVDTQRPIRLLRIQQVLDLVGLKKATLYELHRTGQFPRSVKITTRAVGWIEEEVQRWLAERRDRRP